MREPASLTLDEIEAIEKQSLRALFLAAVELGFDSWDIFYQSHDGPKDAADDVTCGTTINFVRRK